MTALADDYDFFTVGTGDRPFTAYDSSSDPTDLAPTYLVGGSKNVWKDYNNNISVRPGLKRYGPEDDAENGVVSSFEWQTSFGLTRIIRVLEQGEWQVLYNNIWYTIDDFDQTRFVFSPWWADAIQQELLTMVNGSENIYAWSGGITDTVGAVNTAGVMITGASTAESIQVGVSTGETRISVGNNGLSGNSIRSAVVLDSQPLNDDLLTLDIAQTNPFPSTAINIQFKTVLPADAALTAYILIGANKEATAANLLHFLQNPTVSNAQHTLVSNATAQDSINDQTYSAVSSLESGSGDDWADEGFTDGYPGVGSIIVVGGTPYTYTLVAQNYLVNISGTPSTGVVAYQGIDTYDGPMDGFSCDFSATITNQLIVGSYTSTVIYFSADIDFRDFVNAGDIISGDPDQIILDELPRGVIVVGESAYIPAGIGNWYICTPNTPVPISQPLTSGIDRLVLIKVQKRVGAGKSAALAHEFLGAYGENIIYLDQANQLRQFGIFADVLGTKIPTVSQPVRTELQEENFTGGCLRVIEDRTYIISRISGRTYIYQQRDDVDGNGNIVSDKVWQPPLEWNISRIAIIDGVDYGYSSSNPETYQLWDTNQWHDDSSAGPMPYECVARFAYWNFKDRTKIGDLDKVFMEGYMPPDTSLIATLRANYLGSTAVENVIVSENGDDPVLYTETGVLVGENLIGQETIGGGASLTGLPKFRAIAQYKKHECFEYQMEFYSYLLDAQWQLLCIGTNGSTVVNKAPYLLRG